MKKTVAIIGVGLIGGSLGLALRRSGKYRVLGIGRHRAKLRRARRLGAVDAFSTNLSDVSRADVVVLAGPIDTIVPVLRRILPSLKSGAIVTDVGSVKQAVMRGVDQLKLPRAVQFVGGHPLAGSHKTGVEAAHSRLFAGSTVVLVPGSRAALRPLKSLWNAAGAKTIVLSADAHDRAVALISHLPHALAHALVHVLAARKDRKKLLPLLAGSFRDVTRVASSDPDQWAQILRANARPVAGAIQAFRQELARLEKQIPSSKLKTHLRRSQSFRRPLFNGI